MSNGVIAFFCAAGATAWVYNKFDRRTGGETKTAATGAVMVGVIVFLLMLTVLSYIS